MTTLYFISGLGADKRIFSKLDLPEFNLKYIKWIKPEKDESIDSYAFRMSEQINDNDEFILIGVSFGGILANEIARIRNPKATIIISSVKSETEYTLSSKLFNALKLSKLMPYRLIVDKFSKLFFSYMGAETKEDVALFNDLIKQTDFELLKWSIDKIAEWQAKPELSNLYHVHGDDDRIFPIKKVSPDYIIEGGGHFMVFNKADEVSRVIKEIINSL